VLQSVQYRMHAAGEGLCRWKTGTRKEQLGRDEVAQVGGRGRDSEQSKGSCPLQCHRPIARAKEPHMRPVPSLLLSNACLKSPLDEEEELQIWRKRACAHCILCRCQGQYQYDPKGPNTPKNQKPSQFALFPVQAHAIKHQVCGRCGVLDVGVLSRACCPSRIAILLRSVTGCQTRGYTNAVTKCHGRTPFVFGRPY